MDNYIPLALKYRPKRLTDVVGQKNIVTMLENSVKTNRINRVYLFCGPAGTGKTSIARIWSSMLNCNSDEPPCCECNTCKAIANGKSLDVIELNSADKRKIEDIRELLSKIRFKPNSNYKIIIMDEVHMLTNEAWNALLKDLEEPPEYCVFILCTTNPEKIPNTILSRCISFEFNSVSINDVVDRLEYICDVEGFIYDNEALQLIAKKSNGGMRDALSSLEQVAMFSNNEITMDNVLSVFDIIDDNTFKSIISYLHDGMFDNAFSIINELLSKSKSIDMIYSTLQDGYLNELKQYYKHVDNKIRFSKDELLSICKLFSDYEQKVKYSNNKYNVLISLMYEISNLNVSSIYDRVNTLEQKLSNFDGKTLNSNVTNKIDRLRSLVKGNDNKNNVLNKFKEGGGKDETSTGNNDSSVYDSSNDVENDVNDFVSIIGGKIV